jgi:hypothetical protein
LFKLRCNLEFSKDLKEFSGLLKVLVTDILYYHLEILYFKCSL